MMEIRQTRSAETDPPADGEENMLTVKAIEVYKFRLDHHHCEMKVQVCLNQDSYHFTNGG